MDPRSRIICAVALDVGHLAKVLRVGEPVVRGVGGGEPGELVGMGVPVKVAAVDNSATHCRGMAVHILGGRVSHDVGTPLEGAAVDGRGEGVVHDEGHTVAVGDAGKLLYI